MEISGPSYTALVDVDDIHNNIYYIMVYIILICVHTVSRGLLTLRRDSGCFILFLLE